jgi:hypothetical protein
MKVGNEERLKKASKNSRPTQVIFFTAPFPALINLAANPFLSVLDVSGE